MRRGQATKHPDPAIKSLFFFPLSSLIFRSVHFLLPSIRSIVLNHDVSRLFTLFVLPASYSLGCRHTSQEHGSFPFPARSKNMLKPKYAFICPVAQSHVNLCLLSVPDVTNQDCKQCCTSHISHLWRHNPNANHHHRAPVFTFSMPKMAVKAEKAEDYAQWRIITHQMIVTDFPEPHDTLSARLDARGVDYG